MHVYSIRTKTIIQLVLILRSVTYLVYSSSYERPATGRITLHPCPIRLTPSIALHLARQVVPFPDHAVAAAAIITLRSVKRPL